MRNGWKTTTAGLVTAIAGFVAVTPQAFTRYPIVIEISKYIMMGGLAAFGIVARDQHSDTPPPQQPPYKN